MKIRVEFEIEIPIESANNEQIDEWVRFSFHDKGSCKISNPLFEQEIEAVAGSLHWRIV